MFRLYSKGCEYAIRALIEVAPTDAKDKFLAKEVCRKAKIPEFFTRKTLQALVKGKFLRAVPGPGGGYQLIQPPNKISLLNIIQAVDGVDTFDKCIAGLPYCDDKQPCPLHHQWKKTKKEFLSNLEAKTLQDFIDIYNRRKKSKRTK